MALRQLADTDFRCVGCGLWYDYGDPHDPDRCRKPVVTRAEYPGIGRVRVEWRDGDVFEDACRCGGHPRRWTAADLRLAWGRIR